MTRPLASLFLLSSFGITFVLGACGDDAAPPGTDAGPDSGAPDAAPPDGGPDAGSDAGADAGPPPPPYYGDPSDGCEAGEVEATTPVMGAPETVCAPDIGCTTGGDCPPPPSGIAAATTCYGATGRCYLLCDPLGGATECPAGAVCVAASMVVGFCAF